MNGIEWIAKNKLFDLNHIENDFPMELKSMNLIQPNNNNKDNNDHDSQRMFFDSVSHKHIKVSNGKLSIFNSKGDNQVAELSSPFFRNNIHFITLDTQITYCITILTIDNQKLLMGFKIIDSSIVGVIKIEDFDYLLGLFIIKRSNIGIVFVDRINFYPILFPEEIIDQGNLKGITLTTTFINSYSYQSECNLLCCQMNNSTYSFYDLSNWEFCTTEYNVTLPPDLIPKKSLISTAMSYYYAKDEKKEVAQNYHSIAGRYCRSQYFLEVLYDKLYFILLSYENNSISLFSIHYHPNNKSIVLEYAIDYQLHLNNSTLQFINNLIISYNFNLNEMCVFDIKSSAQNHLLCCSNKMLKEGEMGIIKEKCIYITDSQWNPIRLCRAGFNIGKYYDNANEKEKYKALIDIMRRKRSFEAFSSFFNESQVPKDKIAFFINEVLALIWSEGKVKQKDKEGDVCINEETEKLFKDQMNIITSLSKLYTKANNAELLVNHLLIVYYNKMHLNSLISVNYYTILIDYLKRVPIDKLVTLLNRNLLPKSEEVLFFIISLDCFSGKHSKSLQQSKLDYMTQFNLLESVFALIYQMNQVTKALIYWNSLASPPLITKSLKDILIKEKGFLAKNRRIIRQFISKDNE